MIRVLLLSMLLVLFFSSCRNSNSNFETILPSPDSKKHLYFNLNDGEPYYLLYYKNQILIDWSMLGFIVDDTINFNEGLLFDNVVSRTSVHSDSDLFPEIEANLETFNEMTVYLNKVDLKDIQLSIVLRIYNNAVAFKYIFNHLKKNRLAKEMTELDLYNNFFKKVEIRHTMQNEIGISELPVEDIDTLIMPATFVSKDTFKIDYLESLSQDYPRMKLVRRTSDKAEFQMRYTDGYVQNIKIKSGFETPWRIIFITNNLNNQNE